MEPTIIVIIAFGAATTISLIAGVISICSCRRKNTNNETQQERNVEIDIESRIRDDEQYLKIHLKGGIEDTNLLYERNTTNADGNKVAEHLAGTASHCVEVAGTIADSGQKTIAENVVAISDHISRNAEQATSSNQLISGNQIQETKTEEVKYVLGQSANDHMETNTALSSNVVRLIRSMYHEFLQSIVINKLNAAEAQPKHKLPSTYPAVHSMESFHQSQQDADTMQPIPLSNTQHMISRGSLITDDIAASNSNTHFQYKHYSHAGKLYKYRSPNSMEQDEVGSRDALDDNIQNNNARYTTQQHKVSIVPPIISLKKMVQHVSTSSSSLFGASPSNYNRFEENADTQEDIESDQKDKESEDIIENNTNIELSGSENSENDAEQ